jgi:catechol 2,3-dioxygenase-like lactoylglutathione lyase family enzyme
MRMTIRTLFVAALLAWPPQEPSPALAGIAHVAFRVRDVQKSREFYRALGFEQAFEFADLGKPLVSYIKINDRQFIELYGPAEDSQPTGLLHICYEATDIEALRKEYAGRGLDSPSSHKARAGNLLLLIHDPEGQLLEYTQYLPNSLHFEDRGKHLGERRISQQLVRAVIGVRDVQAERLFYQSKLAFEDAGNGIAARLRLPGNSSEEVELEAATRETVARIAFTVPSLAATADELRSRAISVKAGKGSVSVIDPDGVVILFTAGHREPRSAP